MNQTSSLLSCGSHWSVQAHSVRHLLESTKVFKTLDKNPVQAQKQDKQDTLLLGYPGDLGLT